jgi:hypothetical protein
MKQALSIASRPYSIPISHSLHRASPITVLLPITVPLIKAYHPTPNPNLTNQTSTQTDIEREREREGNGVLF